MQQLQQRSYAPPPPLNAGFAYRVRDSDVNVSGGFSQGRGQLQVSARERGAASEALVRDVAGIVAERVVDAATGAFLPPASVERLLRDEANFAPSATRSAKQQALDVIKILERDHGLRRAPSGDDALLVVLNMEGEEVEVVPATLAAPDEPDGWSLLLATPRRDAPRCATEAVRLGDGEGVIYVKTSPHH